MANNHINYQHIISVRHEGLAAALISKGHEPVSSDFDVTGEGLITFKDGKRIRRCIERYANGTLIVNIAALSEAAESIEMQKDMERCWAAYKAGKSTCRE